MPKRRVTKSKRKPTRTGKAQPARYTWRREWDRATDLVTLFVATGAGWLTVKKKPTALDRERPRPASLIFVSEPGHGKTELLERFRANANLEYHSDMTARGFHSVLRKAQEGQTTHLVATEFQKFFQRKATVAENFLGTLVQAMEEGVERVTVGTQELNFNRARAGIIGALTHGTMDKRREFLAEMGFLSRAAIFDWKLPPNEKRDIMRRISRGDQSDLQQINLRLPDVPVAVYFEPKMSARLEAFVWEGWRGEALRVFQRLRSVAMASALVDGRDVIQMKDIDHVLAFNAYWQRMII